MHHFWGENFPTLNVQAFFFSQTLWDLRAQLSTLKTVPISKSTGSSSMANKNNQKVDIWNCFNLVLVTGYCFLLLSPVHLNFLRKKMTDSSRFFTGVSPSTGAITSDMGSIGEFRLSKDHLRPLPIHCHWHSLPCTLGLVVLWGKIARSDWRDGLRGNWWNITTSWITIWLVGIGCCSTAPYWKRFTALQFNIKKTANGGSLEQEIPNLEISMVYLMPHYSCTPGPVVHLFPDRCQPTRANSEITTSC